MHFIVADDHPMYLEAVCSTLRRSFPDSDIVAAGSIDDVLKLAGDAKTCCELILLDFSMPGMVGGAGITRIKQAFPDAPVIIMSGVATLPDVQKALSLGARGFLRKTMMPAHFSAAVSLVIQGGTYLPTDILQEAETASVPASSESPGRPAEFDMLTPREMQVLRLLAQGLMNKEIGRELSLAEMTIKLHVRQILRKIKARNRSEAATIAVRLGLK